MVASLTDNSPADWDIGYVFPVTLLDQPLNGTFIVHIQITLTINLRIVCE